MPRAHIAAVGMTRFGRRDEGLLDLGAQAIEALRDDLGGHLPCDHLLVASAFPGAYGDIANVATAMADRLGLEGTPATRIETAPSSSLAALEVADALVRSRRRDHVLVVGVETMTRLDTAAANEVLARMAPPNERALGVTMAAQVALMTRAYMERFGTTREQLLASPMKAHEAGARNPLAQFQKAVDLRTMLDAPEVAAPLGRYDCAPMSDGAAAFLVTRSAGPVRIAGIGHATDRWALTDRPMPDALTGFPATTAAADQAFKEAGRKRDEVDLVETHDAFSLLEGMNLEDLGFCAKGMGVAAVAAHETRPEGKLPTNVGGGLKARGHPVGATGAAQVCELFWQLTGHDAVRNRQVERPGLALAHNIGGLGNNVLVALLEATR